MPNVLWVQLEHFLVVILSLFKAGEPLVTHGEVETDLEGDAAVESGQARAAVC